MRAKTRRIAAALVFAGLTGCGGPSDKDGGKDTGTETETHDTGSGSETSENTDTVTDTDTHPPDTDLVTWVTLQGGSFKQGSSQGEQINYDETPAHQVSLKGFEIMKNEVTVAQYRACVVSNVCTEPDKGEGCNWGVAGRAEHPINCVDEYQAEKFCAWVDGRLPSESEWEYAARSGGKEPKIHPWGEDKPTCERAVMTDEKGVDGCGLNHTWPVCSKPLGNTEQGLCDMGGNVDEWMPDWYRWSYNGAPTDGSVWDDPTDADSKVIRGGEFSAPVNDVTTRGRYYWVPFARPPIIGFRCARPLSADQDAGMDSGLDAGSKGTRASR
ncbi:MAG: SUMF1/EgtB/PvdO family nonheme iron enzyme [Deltaproteobacteria bacterium]|nr:SUMF1/EgtB/PvdO family nonheme iron enzyme [Deltaproteobacteria bacterium]